jgi:hypothetical protein
MLAVANDLQQPIEIGVVEPLVGCPVQPKKLPPSAPRVRQQPARERIPLVAATLEVLRQQ